MRICSRKEFVEFAQKAQENNQTVVFTNGCFDILHRGHVDYLTEASKLGDVLLVGVNSDKSVVRIKSKGRPLMSEEDRAMLIASLRDVDAVCLFDENTPLQLIRDVLPDILVKGAEYQIKDIVGYEEVVNNGGKVIPISMTPGISTTEIIQRIKWLPD